MTMYGAPLSRRPTSKTRTTCSLLIFAAAFASREKRATQSASRTASGKRNLMATR